jgi:GAF domain-containing protein
LSLVLELQGQLHTAEVLRQVLQDLVAQDDLGLVESTILRHARRISASDGGIIYVWSPEKNALMTLTTIRGGEIFKTRTLKSNEGVAGTAFAEDKPVSVDDYEAWNGRSLQRPRNLLGPAAAVPIRFEGKPIGALCVVRDVSRPPYQEEELEVLEALAQAVAVVVTQKWPKTDR